MGEFPLKDGRSDFALRKKVLAKQVARLEISAGARQPVHSLPLLGEYVPPNHQRSP